MIVGTDEIVPAQVRQDEDVLETSAANVKSQVFVHHLGIGLVNNWINVIQVVQKMWVPPMPPLNMPKMSSLRVSSFKLFISMSIRGLLARWSSMVIFRTVSVRVTENLFDGRIADMRRWVSAHRRQAAFLKGWTWYRWCRQWPRLWRWQGEQLIFIYFCSAIGRWERQTEEGGMWKSRWEWLEWREWDERRSCK